MNRTIVTILIALSFLLNFGVLAVAGWYWFAYRTATGGTSVASGNAVIEEVIAMDSGGYRNRFIIATYKGQRVVVQDYATFSSKPPKPYATGDRVNVQEVKVSPGAGVQVVQYTLMDF